MSTEYEPGTVAVVTDRMGRTGRGICNVRGGWDFTPEGADLSCYANAEWITEVRPLVVLELHPYSRVNALALLTDAITATGGPEDGFLAQIRDAIEAQTKPPRIPEPGLWGVVEANVMGDQSPQADYHWVHLAHDQWEAIGSSQPPRRWAELIDPTLIREGVSDAN